MSLYLSVCIYKLRRQFTVITIAYLKNKIISKIFIIIHENSKQNNQITNANTLIRKKNVNNNLSMEI